MHINCLTICDMILDVSTGGEEPLICFDQSDYSETNLTVEL